MSEQLGQPETSVGAQRVAAQDLRGFIAALFEKANVPAADADVAADILVSADLRGVWSHGVARVPMYLERMRRGVMQPAPDLTPQRVAPAAALLDGQAGFGLIVAPRAMREAITLASETGVGLVGVKNSNHFGTAAYYAQMAADAGCIGLVFTNASPAVPPWGGADAFFGTSPFAMSSPVEDGRAFTLDLAMTRIARGKLKFAAARGEPIPAGYALDREGRPTRDGAAAFKGTMLPFGEHKGAGLSWMMDVLAGVFTGAAFGGRIGNPFTGMQRPADVGHLFVAMRANLFMPMDAYLGRMSELDTTAKLVRKAEGFSEILSPGEPEERKRATNEQIGIPLPQNVIKDLNEVAETYGVAVPF